MRAILTTVGQDKTGIVAGVSGFLAEKEINILKDRIAFFILKYSPFIIKLPTTKLPAAKTTYY